MRSDKRRRSRDYEVAQWRKELSLVRRGTLIFLLSAVVGAAGGAFAAVANSNGGSAWFAFMVIVVPANALIFYFLDDRDAKQ